MAGRPTPDETKRADTNRERSLAAHRRLHELIAIVTAPDFDGTVAIELSAKRGLMNRPKSTVVRYEGQEPG